MGCQARFTFFLFFDLFPDSWSFVTRDIFLVANVNTFLRSVVLVEGLQL